MSEEKLKPCPFCGSTSVSVWQLSDIPPYPEIPMNWVAGCVACDVQINAFNSAAEAAKAWNRRAAETPRPAEAEVQRLRRALIRLYLDEQLSEGQLTIALAVDRLEARTMVEVFKRVELTAPPAEMPRPESWSLGLNWGEWQIVARDVEAGAIPDPFDFDEEQAERDEELYNQTVTCETCGGESGDGWSTCTCDDDDPDYDDPYGEYGEPVSAAELAADLDPPPDDARTAALLAQAFAKAPRVEISLETPDAFGLATILRLCALDYNLPPALRLTAGRLAGEFADVVSEAAPEAGAVLKGKGDD